MTEAPAAPGSPFLSCIFNLTQAKKVLEMPVSSHPQPCSPPLPPPPPLLKPSDPHSFRPSPVSDPLQHKTDQVAPPLGACLWLPPPAYWPLAPPTSFLSTVCSV